ncbi:glycosyltransferase family protein [Pontibacter sp. 13R65]|uniref:glycosyltransferase family protein n=1 Tax=Pontibacter sp. 13R65 TaxID=3127458 RepID=UPI00301E17A1
MVKETIGAIIQVRLGSERLPQKALLPLPFSGGPTLLEHVVSRAKMSYHLHHIIVATTTAPADDQIAEFCKKKGIVYYRGEEQDVLARFFAAASAYDLSTIVRLTGDNPCVSAEVIDYAIEHHLKTEAAYTRTEGLPLGTNVEAFSYKALQQAHQLAKAPFEREHVTPFMYSAKSNRPIQLINMSDSVPTELKHLRLTIDYPSDYAMISLLFEKVQADFTSFSIQTLKAILQNWPWLAQINASNNQKKIYNSEQDELADAARLLQQAGMDSSANYILLKNSRD